MGKNKKMKKTSYKKIKKSLTGILMVLGFFALSAKAQAGTTNLTACGVLDTAGETYVLQNDVQSDGTCFYITKGDIVLDLNGKTVIYDNIAPTLVPNGSFEADLNGTWDVSGAPNASSITGTFTGPVQVSEGTHSLKFATPTANQQVVSVGKVTLPANTTMYLWMMLYNQISDNITVSVELDGASGVVASKSGKTWRGFMPVGISYKTGPIPETYNLKISISGAESAPTGAVYVDDVRIARYRAHGMALGATDEVFAGLHRCPDCATFSSTWYPNITVKNGTLRQGQDAGFDSWAIWMGGNTATLKGGHVIENIISETNGPDSRFFSLPGGGLYNSEIRYNTSRNSNRIISSRDNYSGSAIKIESTTGSTLSKIHHNTFESGPHNAIYAGSDGSAAALEIYSNSISLQTYHTNDFAISAGGSKVYDNVINCANADNSCRGIMIGNKAGGVAYGNVINVRQLRRNQEYNGCEGGSGVMGAYGIQIEGAAKDIEVYGNTVNAYAEECSASALRLNLSSTATNINVHNNIFNAISANQYPGERASALKLSGPSSGPIANPLETYKINSNIFNTNDAWVLVDEKMEKGVRLTGNTWKTSGTLRSPFHPFITYWTGYPEAWVFAENVYGSGDKERFESALFRDTSSGAIKAEASFSIVSKSYVLADFLQLISDWLKTIVSPADVNGDGKVNSRDLGIMMSKWQ